MDIFGMEARDETLSDGAALMKLEWEDGKSMLAKGPNSGID